VVLTFVVLPLIFLLAIFSLEFLFSSVSLLFSVFGNRRSFQNSTLSSTFFLKYFHAAIESGVLCSIDVGKLDS
jgi:hypothetical protein